MKTKDLKVGEVYAYSYRRQQSYSLMQRAIVLKTRTGRQGKQVACAVSHDGQAWYPYFLNPANIQFTWEVLERRLAESTAYYKREAERREQEKAQQEQDHSRLQRIFDDAGVAVKWVQGYYSSSPETVEAKDILALLEVLVPDMVGPGTGREENA